MMTPGSNSVNPNGSQGSGESPLPPFPEAQAREKLRAEQAENKRKREAEKKIGQAVTDAVPPEKAQLATEVLNGVEIQDTVHLNVNNEQKQIEPTVEVAPAPAPALELKAEPEPVPVPTQNIQPNVDEQVAVEPIDEKASSVKTVQELEASIKGLEARALALVSKMPLDMVELDKIKAKANEEKQQLKEFNVSSEPTAIGAQPTVAGTKTMNANVVGAIQVDQEKPPRPSI